MRSYPQYIDGKDVDGQRWTYVVRASAMLRDVDSAFNLKRGLELGRITEVTDDVVARCAVGTVADSDSALEAARRASRVYRLLPQETRSRIVLDFNEALAARADEMIDILIAEGHPRRLAQWEVSGMLRGTDEATIRWYESQLHQCFEVEGKHLELVRKPDGVVCVNPPQNAAGSNSTMGVFALLAGNAIVVKAPRSSPLSVMFLFRDLLAPILERHGAPPGTLNVVCGNAGGILRSWVTSPLVDDILFFGDSDAGLKLGEECLKNGKKAVLELAGNDGFVVWRDADLEAAARALEECFYGSSQICMVPKYAVLHPEIADDFTELFVERVRKLRPGFPEDPEILLSPVLKVDKFFDFIAEAREAGAELLCGGARVDVHGAPSTRGMFCEPTVVRVEGLARAGGLSLVREETFFPLIPLVVPEAAPDDQLFDRVVEFLDDNVYGLRNSMWTGDPRLARRFADGVTNGGLLKVNDSHIGFNAILSTHGGTGRTGGPYGELNYAGLRTSHLQGVSWGDGDPRPLDPRVLASGERAQG
ncbi:MULTISPECIES: aldehyde dehydrogenase family protein [Streptomyces]|uniref:aldehyde dehydrogenase family protein n=1 Tax=Streptomyces TaxID=1883 RepID=UPI00292DCA03|nr:aldehyde dehydrogenase [Streptomyces sp. NEAU-HV9]